MELARQRLHAASRSQPARLCRPCTPQLRQRVVGCGLVLRSPAPAGRLMQNQPLLDSCVPGSMPHLMIRKGSCVWASREWSMLESSACADYQTFVVQDGVAQRKGRGTMPEYKGY